MEKGKLQSIELRVTSDKGQQQVHFWQAGEKYSSLHLWSKDEEEYFVLDHPISETLSSWAELNIIDQEVENDKTFNVIPKWYGLKPLELSFLKNLANQIREAIKDETHLSIDLTSVFDPTHWAITFE